ncbi:Gmad2 immunoglobulin-like domain-containing protein [Paenibacillus sacheonensis]|uniref:Bacterial spore germination immunoglobulin-like domain-containing protein n=1 Tax=Paenibacillus sacheonensis TaxID=742054 RepID=A0A7X5C4N1_9BACL|nr:Gmad2 immunoglobulin-like domain-containing protein [Paenibacillus sacheonensis]MBM7566627.1 hypothetical protein [Paenibacillus sacheonensis]NBC73545.1 hypothetical protein [Paenibacillus sacheonensis]
MRRSYAFLGGMIVLMLVCAVLAGCSEDNGGVANAPGKSPSTDQGDNSGVTPSSNNGTQANNGGDSTIDPTPSNGTNTGNGGAASEPGGQVNNDAGTGSAPKGQANDNAGTATDDGKPKIVASNEAFRVYGPAPDSVVGEKFTVKGQARVFEAAFSYSFEDGHNILDEGHTMADMGAPEWGEFEFKVSLKEIPTSPTGVLTIYESSAKDGSPVHELHIPYKFEDGLVKLETE